MTIAGLLSALFNLGAQTDFWNSNQAASLFWLVFTVVMAAAIVYFGLRKVRHRRRGRPFGHSL